ncbi:hypothetical protein [Deinococcus marmoris]|uniref:hypothetical protein n=1 Tax=Deinococcus marmoris TaxID=249408 RepID=UPI0004982177|nr:hypothetical protein [Deinococcus marmoris]
MNNLFFLSALAFSRTALRDLLGEVHDASTPVGALVEAERATPRVHVAEALRCGKVLRAALSPKASPHFREGMRAALSPALHPLVAALAEEWAPVLADAEALHASFGGSYLRHLPQCIQELGHLPAEETRAVVLALLDDPVMLGLWVEAQDDGSLSTPAGLLKYAVSNSAFMDALELFGVQFNVAAPGETARYVFALDHAQELYVERGGEAVCVADLGAADHVPPTPHGETADVEAELQHRCGLWPSFGEAERAAFGDLYAHLLDVACTRPGTLAGIRAGDTPLLSGRQQKAIADRHGLPAAVLARVVGIFRQALERLEDCR